MIRRAKPSEIVQLMAITKACAAKMAAENIFQWNDDYPTTAAFSFDVSRNELFVLLEQDTIIGCITISTFKDAEYNTINWLTEDGLNYYIHRLAIAPEFQHQGNAKKLMDFAEAFARDKNATSVRLDTFSENKRNQQFYDARGYVKLGDVYFPRQTAIPFHCYELVL
ncbi:GNAT family N-acetyltransferase [Rasiella rasia]|uniref:GNAT family N-acetyltransferase n=1 Tax=Rasiella rasia TaxID=2744027 RepID=A0A6G6GMS8_9FLAO|nr:GNAT family N-acetyltransferase [Rasiella rasia]QIE59827.1 GNAT family N-acetyltransferase [Rasiella rasia]